MSQAIENAAKSANKKRARRAMNRMLRGRIPEALGDLVDGYLEEEPEMDESRLVRASVREFLKRKGYLEGK